MELFVDVASNSLNKVNEELCGDRVEVVKDDDTTIIVLADGLGSGVKANILSTLTTKIAATMIKNGEDIFETVDTIINTLPVCSVRGVAYSTFTIVIMNNNGRVYLAEYDNPPCFLHRNGRSIDIEREKININGKIIKVSDFTMQEGDILTSISDGVIHAGIGEVLNLGWQWDEVNQFLAKVSQGKKCAKNISNSLSQACLDLYGGRPGDDTTVVSIKARKPEYVDLFTGPPEDHNKDEIIVKKLMEGQGKKIVCGGTAANITEKVLHKKLKVDMTCMTADLPPIAYLEGIDLVTEGVLTLDRTVKIIDKLELGKISDINSQDPNGAEILSKILVDDCTHLTLWVGRAINPAHQNPNFPEGLNIKLNIVDKLIKCMEKLGKKVKINYL
ncbi:SpoIIE family protein phosphatase [Oceanirhabdus seepicola]|uniref:SpoIIE family protein phosphatase n=1 Tax=Oceanirhabdus seepicola TaxID=2828781 RepID=A0A9J6P1P4_9CLOT|nr:SpoIIE family protein phosphatase [Oceanirhabdus seepicola]MCM1989805.1 SpoIIE family protein phosphatase [Oceanirhabdus seepicola]